MTPHPAGLTSTGENWRCWAGEKPNNGEVFVGYWSEYSTLVCRYIEPAPGLRPEVHVHGTGPIGIGPMTTAPDWWLRLPDPPAGRYRQRQHQGAA